MAVKKTAYRFLFFPLAKVLVVWRRSAAQSKRLMRRIILPFRPIISSFFFIRITVFSLLWLRLFLDRSDQFFLRRRFVLFEKCPPKFELFLEILAVPIFDIIFNLRHWKDFIIILILSFVRSPKRTFVPFEEFFFLRKPLIFFDTIFFHFFLSLFLDCLKTG